MNFIIIFLVLICGVFCARCEDQGKKWWEHTSIYEIYPRSFKDSDGDGIGDLKGITSKLEYLKEIGTEVIRITHLYKTSNRDSDRYEIMNHKEIDPIIGTLEDFEELVKEAHEKSMKIMIDFVPNHTSDSHPWFLNSIHEDPIYSDYYVWKNGSQNEPPNKWRSLLSRTSAWCYHRKRNEWYYHILSSNQPDLNLRNPKVVQEVKDILRFWLSKMVDGFFLTEAGYLIEDELLSEESINNNSGETESAKLVYEFKKEIGEYEGGVGSDRILIAHMDNSYSITGSEGQEIPSSHLVFQGSILDGFERHLSTSMGFLKMYIIVQAKFLCYNSETLKIWASNTLGTRRISGALDEEVSDVIIGLTALLPGVMYTFYGSELGMHGRIEPNHYFFKEHLGYIDQSRRAKYAEKLPMQWNNEDNAGFTTALKPWMDNNPDYWTCNVKSEELDPNSHLNFYKKLMSLRKSPTLIYGEVQNYDSNYKVFAFSRLLPGHESYTVISNFNCDTITFDLETTLVIRNYKTKTDVIGKAIANLTSLFTVAGSGNSLHKPGDVITRNSDGKLLLTMRPRSQVILSDQNIINKHTVKKEGREPFEDFSSAPIGLMLLITVIGLIIFKLK